MASLGDILNAAETLVGLGEGRRVDTPASAMALSPGGADFIKSQEAYRANVYDDGAGNATVGYGHRVFGSNRAPINRERAEVLFAQDAAKVEKALRSSVAVPLTQGQYDALVSFGFNAGTGALAKIVSTLNAGDYAGALDRMGKYVYASGNRMNGLVNRRVAETALWNGEAPTGGKGIASSSKPQVSALQYALSNAGFSPGKIDGNFGDKTKAAVEKFQKANGLTVDGIAGPKTMAALSGAVSPSISGTAVAGLGKSPSAGADVAGDPFGYQRDSLTYDSKMYSPSLADAWGASAMPSGSSPNLATATNPFGPAAGGRLGVPAGVASQGALKGGGLLGTPAGQVTAPAQKVPGGGIGWSPSVANAGTAPVPPGTEAMANRFVNDFLTQAIEMHQKGMSNAEITNAIYAPQDRAAAKKMLDAISPATMKTMGANIVSKGTGFMANAAKFFADPSVTPFGVISKLPPDVQRIAADLYDSKYSLPVPSNMTRTPPANTLPLPPEFAGVWGVPYAGMKSDPFAAASSAKSMTAIPAASKVSATTPNFVRPAPQPSPLPAAPSLAGKVLGGSVPITALGGSAPLMTGTAAHAGKVADDTIASLPTIGAPAAALPTVAAPKVMPATIPRPGASLAAASYNPAVAQLQTALNAVGAALRVDGIMGPRTQAALESYRSMAAAPIAAPRIAVQGGAGGGGAAGRGSVVNTSPSATFGNTDAFGHQYGTPGYGTIPGHI